MSNSSMNIHGITGISVKPVYSLDSGTRVQRFIFEQTDGSTFDLAVFLREGAPELAVAPPQPVHFSEIVE